jgi:hypothetical protein
MTHRCRTGTFVDESEQIGTYLIINFVSKIKRLPKIKGTLSALPWYVDRARPFSKWATRHSCAVVFTSTWGELSLQPTGRGEEDTEMGSIAELLKNDWYLYCSI